MNFNACDNVSLWLVLLMEPQSLPSVSYSGEILIACQFLFSPFSSLSLSNQQYVLDIAL